MKRRIILCGPAGSGKDFFRDYLNGKLPLDVSYTTRPARTGEKPGYTYNYITTEDFLEKRKNHFFLESVEFNGWHYGTSLTNWQEKEVFISTPSGIKKMPDEDLTSAFIVYFNIPIEKRRERLLKRSDADSVERRILADEKDFKGFDSFNVEVTNPEFICGALMDFINFLGEEGWDGEE